MKKIELPKKSYFKREAIFDMQAQQTKNSKAKDAYNSKSDPNNDIKMVGFHIDIAKPNHRLAEVGKQLEAGPRLRAQSRSGLAATKANEFEPETDKQQRAHSISKGSAQHAEK